MAGQRCVGGSCSARLEYSLEDGEHSRLSWVRGSVGSGTVM